MTRDCNYGTYLQFFVVNVRRAGTDGNILQNLGVCLRKSDPFVYGVMLVDADEESVFGKALGDFEGAGGVHVRRHDGHPFVRRLRIAKRKLPLKHHLKHTYVNHETLKSLEPLSATADSTV